MDLIFQCGTTNHWTWLRFFQKGLQIRGFMILTSHPIHRTPFLILCGRFNEETLKYSWLKDVRLDLYDHSVGFYEWWFFSVQRLKHIRRISKNLKLVLFHIVVYYLLFYVFWKEMDITGISWKHFLEYDIVELTANFLYNHEWRWGERFSIQLMMLGFPSTIGITFSFFLFVFSVHIKESFWIKAEIICFIY